MTSLYNFEKNLVKKEFSFTTEINEIQKENENNLKENFVGLENNEEETKKLIRNIISINFSEFKESIHKEYLRFQHKINDSIQNYSKELNSLSNYQKILLEQFSNIKIKTEKIEILSDKFSKFEDKLTVLEIRLNNLSRDYQKSVSKYDDLFLDNMNVPGKIGKFCKFKNVREFLSFAFDKFSHYDFKNENYEAKMKDNKEKIEKLSQKITSEMKLTKDESNHLFLKQLAFIENKLNDEIQEINRKFELIPKIILLEDFENKIRDLMDNYKDVKNDLSYRLNNVENELEGAKTYKNPKKKKHSPKKDSKVSFTSLSLYPLNNSKEKNNSNSKKRIESKFPKNMLKYKTFSKNNSNLKQKNIKLRNDIKKEKISNLFYVDEEYDENNDISPLNKIKSLNFSNYKKSNVSDSSIDNNENNSSFKKDKNKRNSCDEVESLSSHSLADSNYTYPKKENIEKIIFDNKSQNEKNEKIKIKVGRNGSLGDIELLISNPFKNKTENFSNFKDRKYSYNNEKNHNILTIKPKIKLKNIFENINNKNDFNIINIDNKNITNENSNIKGKNSLKKSKKILKQSKSYNNNKKDFNTIKKIKLKKNNNIKIIKNNNNKKENKINKNIKNEDFIHNIDDKNFVPMNKDSKKNNFFNTKTLKNKAKNLEDEKESNNLNKYNKSTDYPEINNIQRTSNSNGNFSHNILNNIINFPNQEINNKNKDLQITKAYYSLYQIEKLKKELIKTNILSTKDIPIITNSSMQMISNSKKNFEKDKKLVIIKNKSDYNAKKQRKKINLDLKIIPANFKDSKRLQIN